MAETIIDLFETIEVEKHHRRGLTIAPRLGQGLVETILAQAQTGQTGKRIVIGEKMQLGGNFFALLDFDLQLLDGVGQFTGAFNDLLLERIARLYNFLFSIFLFGNIL